MDSTHEIWEILVPATDSDGADVPVSYHREWDAEVRKITEGLTILSEAKGEWVSPEGKLFREPMIPVRIACEGNEIDRIIDFTLEHYDQEAVMAYCISDRVIVRERSST